MGQGLGPAELQSQGGLNTSPGSLHALMDKGLYE